MTNEKSETNTFSYIARQKVVEVCVALSSIPLACVDNQISRRFPGGSKSGEFRKPTQGRSETVESLHD